MAPPPPTAHLFRPRLPLDPFDIPWLIAPFSIQNPNAHVILVLGAPSSIDIVPLTTSPHLSNSLIILATHTPPPIPINPACAIIILHLPAPLAVHDNGALRLVSLLERAQRVAHTWLSTNRTTRILQLAEQQPGGEFTRHEAIELASFPQPPPKSSPLNPNEKSSVNSPVHFSVTTKKHVKQAPLFTALLNFLPPTLPDKVLLKHAVLVTTLSASFLAPPTPLSTSPYDTHPKHSRRSIFTPSKSTPNLTVPPSSKRSPLSFFFNSTSASSSPLTSTAPSVESLSPKAKQKQKYQDPAPQNSKPHIIHVLPYSAFFPPSASRPSSAGSVPNNNTLHPNSHSLHPNRRASAMAPARPYPKQKPRKTKLVQSLEQFLLSHAYPLSMPPHPIPSPASSRPTSMCSTYSMSTTVGPGAAFLIDGAGEGRGAVVPFVVPPGVLGCVSHSHGMSVGEMVVLGALDRVAAGEAQAQGEGEGGEGKWPRAWIGDGGDVAVGEREPVPRVHAHVQQQKPGHEGGKRGLQQRCVNEAGLLTPPESSSSLEGEANASPSVSASPSGSTEGEGGLPSPVSSRSLSDEDGRWIRAKETEREAQMGARHHDQRGGVEGARYSAGKGWTVEDKTDSLKCRVSSIFRRGLGAPSKPKTRPDPASLSLRR